MADYFATFNPMHGSINEQFIKAIHYDFWAGFLLFLILACIVAYTAYKLNYCSWLNN